MMLCDRLEKSLAARDDTRGVLLVDMLNEALGQDETGAGRQRVIPRYSLESGIQTRRGFPLDSGFRRNDEYETPV